MSNLKSIVYTKNKLVNWMTSQPPRHVASFLKRVGGVHTWSVTSISLFIFLFQLFHFSLGGANSFIIHLFKCKCEKNLCWKSGGGKWKAPFITPPPSPTDATYLPPKTYYNLCWKQLINTETKTHIIVFFL